MSKKKNKPLSRLDERREMFLSTMPASLGPGPLGDVLASCYAQAALAFAEPSLERCTVGGLRDGVRRFDAVVDQWLSNVKKVVKLFDTGSSEIACKAGCNYCCHKRVSCLAPTAISVAHHLKTSLSDGRLMDLIISLKQYEKVKVSLSAREFGNYSLLCPLNHDGICISYVTRPLPCRNYHSFDVEKCLADLENPDNAIEIPSDPNKVLVIGVAARAQRETLRRLGLNANELEFIIALRIALTDPTAADRYVQGEDAFAEAYRPDVIEAQSKSAERRAVTQLPQAK